MFQPRKLISTSLLYIPFQPHFSTSLPYVLQPLGLASCRPISATIQHFTHLFTTSQQPLLSFFNDSTSHATSVQPHYIPVEPHFNLAALCYNTLSVQLQYVYRFSHNSTFYTSFLHHNTASPQIHKCFNLGTSVQPHGIPFQPPFNLAPM
jgi:hypothetical protein